jgi:transposase
LAKGVLRKKRSDLALALDGRVNEHHKYVLRLQLERIEGLDAEITELDRRINEKLAPFKTQVDLLVTIHGVDRVLAAVIVAEIGVDMSAFPSAQNLCAWAGVCPGNNITGGKRYSSKSRRGNIPLKTALVEASHAAARKKGSYLRSRYFRIAARAGKGKAAMAGAHKILVAAYYMLSRNEPYRDLGDAYLDRLGKTRLTHNLVKRLERLGYQVEIQAA